MKRIIIVATSLLSFNSCVSIKEIGQLNMVSTRNIETTVKYRQIKRYVTLTKEEKKKTVAASIQIAVDEVVRKVDGGEYLMNAKIYLITHNHGGYVPPDYFYAVEGDVWGVGSNTNSGFNVGDKVTWKKGKTFVKGEINALKDDKTCIVETDDGRIIELKYDEITRSK